MPYCRIIIVFIMINHHAVATSAQAFSRLQQHLSHGLVLNFVRRKFVGLPELLQEFLGDDFPFEIAWFLAVSNP